MMNEVTDISNSNQQIGTSRAIELKIDRLELHVLVQFFALVFFLSLLQKLVDFVYVMRLQRRAIIVVPCVPGFPSGLFLFIVLVKLVVTVLTPTGLTTGLVVKVAGTVFLQAMRLLACAVHERVVNWVHCLWVAFPSHLEIRSLMSNVIPPELKLQFPLFLFNQSVSQIFAILALAKTRVALTSFPVTAAVHFEAFNVFAETSTRGMDHLFLRQKLVFELYAFRAAQPNDAKFIRVQKTAAMLPVTLLD
jgi:hypothetical protein